MSRRAKKIVDGGKMWQTMSLSLFLMLLAFFIVLTTMTETSDEKFAEIQDSIKAKFAPDGIESLESLSDSQTDNFERNAGQAFDDIEALMKAQIGLISVTRAADNKLMKISMPKKKLYNLSLATSGEGNIAQKLSNIISNAQKNGVSISTEAIAHYKMKNYEKELFRKDALGVGRIARVLVSTGVQKDMVFIGTLPGDDKMVTFYFHRLPKNYQKQTDFAAFSYSQFRDRGDF